MLPKLGAVAAADNVPDRCCCGISPHVNAALRLVW